MKKLLMVMVLLLLSVSITGCGRGLNFTEEEFMEAGVLRMAEGDSERTATLQVTYDDNDEITDIRLIEQVSDLEWCWNTYLEKYRYTISKEDWLNSEEYKQYIENDYYTEDDVEWEAGEQYTEVTIDEESLTVTSVCSPDNGIKSLYIKDENTYEMLEGLLENATIKGITYEKING